MFFKQIKIIVSLVAIHLKSVADGSNRRALTYKQTNGHYQTYYLPCFAVDNKDTLQHTFIFDVPTEEMNNFNNFFRSFAQMAG